MENPFKFGGIVKFPYFADREEELDELTREMNNMGKIFLISPRRYGKTCLLFNLMESLNRLGFATAYIDLNAYPDLRSLSAATTLTTSRALESNTDKLLKLFSSLQKIRPKASVSLDGTVEVGVETVVGEKDALSAMLEGMNHAETLAKRKKKKLITIIDEFSDITKYDGQTLERVLRSEIQKQDNIGYIFSGSEHSVMLSMVKDKTRAFYKMGRIMELGPINRDAYLKFIFKWFKKGTYVVDEKAIGEIFELGKDVPFNIQRICHNVWELARENRKVTSDLIQKSLHIIARQDSPHYELLWHSISQVQKSILIAISKEAAPRPFSKDFQLKYGIGPSSTIKASLDSLTKRGILMKTIKGEYKFSDTFMPYWINNILHFV